MVINEKVRANFPVLSLLAFCGVIAAAVWQAAAINHAIQNQFLEMSRAIASLDAKVIGKGPNGWHYPQQDRFCIEAEQMNAGWKCPDPRSIIDRTFVP